MTRKYSIVSAGTVRGWHLQEEGKGISNSGAPPLLFWFSPSATNKPHKEGKGKLSLQHICAGKRKKGTLQHLVHETCSAGAARDK